MDVFILCCDVVVLFVVVFGIVGNMFICVCIIKFCLLRIYINVSLMSILIGNLVVCFILFLLCVYFFMVLKMDEESWDLLCRVVVFFRIFNDMF